MKSLWISLAPIVLFSSLAQSAPSVYSKTCATFMASVGSIPMAERFPEGPIRDEFVARARLMLWYERAATMDARVTVGISKIDTVVRQMGLPTVNFAPILARSGSWGDETYYLGINQLFGHAEFITPELISLVLRALRFQLRDSYQRVEYIEGLSSSVPIQNRRIDQATPTDRARAYEISVTQMQKNYRREMYDFDAELALALASLEPSTDTQLRRKAQSLMQGQSQLPAYFADSLATSVEFMDENPEFQMTKNFETYIEALRTMSRYFDGNPDAGLEQ